MEFGNLGGLWWGLLAFPIVVLYILKIRLRRQPVSTLLFWNQLFEEKLPRSIWQRLRHLLSLLLQLAFLSLLVAALIDPFWSWERLQARRLVLVIDNSASMNATDVSPTRLDDAKKRAESLIRGLRLRDEMAIVSAGSVPRVECGLTNHQRTLRQTIKDVTGTHGPTRIPDAIRLAKRFLAGHENRKIMVLTDGCWTADAEIEGDEEIELVQEGEEADNVGITKYQTRRSLVDPIGYQILVEVTNFSEEDVECRLELALGEELVDVVPLELGPEEVWSKSIDQVSATGGHLIARLDHDDALASDNEAVAILPERKRLPVILVTEGSLFLQRVFEAIPLVDLTTVETIPDSVPSGSILVLHRTIPQKLPTGRVLAIDPPGSCDLWNLTGPVEHPIVTEQDDDSPLITHVHLQNVLMPEAKKLEFTTDVQTLASSVAGESLYAAVERSEGKVLVLTVNLAKGDLPLRIAFPVMMTNAIGWFQGEQGELREAITAGAFVDVDLSPLAEVDRPRAESGGELESVNTANGSQRVPSLVLRSPTGDVRELPPAVQETTIGPFDQCGVWTIEEPVEENRESAVNADTATLQFACNLASSAESDLRPKQKTGAIAQAGIFGVGGRPIWYYVIAVAFLLIVLEWYLYQRRWIS